MSSQSFGKYELVRKLATGGMAEVWLAQQTGIEGFERQIVIKRILPHLAEDQDFIRMFLNEAKISAKFSHPNIGQVFDLGQIDGTYYIAMEYIHGEDLGRVMRKAWSTGQWVSRPLAIRIIASACEGLAYAHSKVDERGRPLNVVHRDFSPQNLLISFDGAVKVVDFGIAKASDATAMTKSGAIKGKFAYMSPEQAGGKVLDSRSDIFAVGLVLYELLTGVRPLKRDTELATLQAALSCSIEPPSQVADVPGELDGVVMRALARSTDERYEDARQFQNALEEFLVSQRWVVGSMQIAELMRTLFADRLKSEAAGEYSPRRSSASNPAYQPDPNSAAIPRSTPRSGGSQPKSGPMTSAGGRHPSEISWDAPPGSSNPQVSARGGLNPSEVPWDAPPGAFDPQLRADPGQTKAKSSPGQISEVVPPHEPAQEAALDEDDDEVSSLIPQERRSVLHPSRNKDVPSERDPSPTRLRPAKEFRAPKVKPQEAEPLEETLEESRAPKGRRLVAGAAIAAVLAVVAAVRTDAKGDLAHLADLAQRFFSKSPDGTQPIFLNVISNLPGQVRVIHSEKDAPDAQTVLGDLPLTHAAGAHVGDTIVIENKARGALYKKTIQFGEPGEVLSIRKEFKTGAVLPVLLHAPAHGLRFFVNGQEGADYAPGLKFELVEGDYELEIRGEALKQPVRFHLKVTGDALNKTPTIDLASRLKPTKAGNQ